MSKQATGCAGIYVNQQGENEIVISQGAMCDLTLSNVKENLLQHMDAKLIVFQSEQSFEDFFEILQFVRQRSSAKILFNPAPYRADYQYERVLPLVDVVVPNETEFASI